jgi:hypothetical protein
MHRTMNASEFFIKSLTTDVVSTERKVRATNAGRRLGAPNMYWPHICGKFKQLKEALIVISIVFTLR